MYQANQMSAASGSIGTPVTPRNSPVEAELARLKSDIADVASLTAELQQRLSAVLDKSPTTDSKAVPEEIPRGYLCTELREASRSVEHLRAALGQTIADLTL